MKTYLNKALQATQFTIHANKLRLFFLTIVAIVINQVLFPFVNVDIKMLQQFSKWQFLKISLLQLMH